MTEENTNKIENIEKLVEYISDNAKNIIVMTGAGISVSAGIPDFRTPGTGLYSQLEKYDLPYPEAIFSIDYFKKNPKPFYTLAKEIYPGNFCPTPTHYFIRLLAEKGLLLRNYTQNIDSLENEAGIDKDLIVAAHGNFDTASTIKGKHKINPEEVKASIMEGEEGWKRMRQKYGELIKPDIVFFGESLPYRFYELMNEDFKNCDLLIVMGTSLQVQPFASLINLVSEDTPRLLINREEVGNFNKEKDITLLKDCDEGVRELACSLGWSVELETLISKETKKWKKK